MIKNGHGKHVFLILSSTELITKPTDTITSNAVLILKHLVQSQLQSHLSTPFDLSTSSTSPTTIISHLARKIDDIKHPQARACVLWLVGQYAGTTGQGMGGVEGVAEWAPDVLRKGAKGFTQEVIINSSPASLPSLSNQHLSLPGTNSQTPNNNPSSQTPHSKPNAPNTPATHSICILTR